MRRRRLGFDVRPSGAAEDREKRCGKRPPSSTGARRDAAGSPQYLPAACRGKRRVRRPFVTAAGLQENIARLSSLPARRRLPASLRRVERQASGRSRRSFTSQKSQEKTERNKKKAGDETVLKKKNGAFCVLGCQRKQTPRAAAQTVEQLQMQRVTFT